MGKERIQNPKPKTQPWNEMRFVLDRKIRRMNCLQRGMVRSLLQQAFVVDERPYLPNDDDYLWALADCDSKDQWMENKDAILEIFETREVGGKTVLAHPPTEIDFNKFLKKRLDADEKGYVYFIQGEESRRIKIGYASTSPGDRLTSLKTASPEKLVPLGYERAPKRREKELHRMWQDQRVHGEWFEESPELLQYIKDHNDAKKGG